MENNDVKYRLNSVNWNFDFNISYDTNSLFPFDCRKHYSYPATFIPEIPFTLIEILSKKGDIVLDPFGGIGTTFIQALLLERQPFTCDINPTATSVCLGLYDLLSPSLNRDSLKQQLLNLCEGYDENFDYTNDITDFQKTLAGWYEKETYNKLCYLIYSYNVLENGVLKTIAQLVISSILSTLSSQNKGWAYIADNVKPKDDEFKDKPVFDVFRTRVKILFADIECHISNLSSSFDNFYLETQNRQRIFNSSVLDADIPSVDLIITSPPYPKMIDYVKSQRMALCFLNERHEKFTEQEIGARCRRARKNTLEEYKASMLSINEHLCNLLKPNGFLCLILPDYSEKDERKQIIDDIIKSYEEFGLKTIDCFKRYIPSNRRTISIQWASLVNEKILVFRKEG